LSTSFDWALAEPSINAIVATATPAAAKVFFIVMIVSSSIGIFACPLSRGGRPFGGQLPGRG
jgi:hypothetical protein